LNVEDFLKYCEREGIFNNLGISKTKQDNLYKIINMFIKSEEQIGKEWFRREFPEIVKDAFERVGIKTGRDLERDGVKIGKEYIKLREAFK